MVQVVLNSPPRTKEQADGKETEACTDEEGKRHEVPEATKLVKLKKRSKKGKRR